MHKLVEVTQVARGLITLKDFLDEADVARVEQILVDCVKTADFQVNEREYGRGKSPSDAECDRVVDHDKNGEEVTRAMQLGTMKHAVAFACVEQALGPEFSGHVTREPRYGKNPSTGEYALTDKLKSSLVPDVVLHFIRDANRIQLLYDFYFPCTSNKKSNPFGAAGRTLREKLDKYESLRGQKRPALVTPQLGVIR
ncbi:hypothetical protein ACN28E_00580 [Archangium lansingense]|uniref:hypothetical protein n=1 Tax=Archangium lansingense TaxID=2995310 RepID=UPI003B7C7C24